MIQRIEIEFALPVELTDAETRTLCDMVQAIAKRHQPEGWVHWQSGVGQKPILSQADQRFLGKPVDPQAPESGEPTWDEEVLHIETAARPKNPTEAIREVTGRPLARKFVYQFLDLPTHTQFHIAKTLGLGGDEVPEANNTALFVKWFKLAKESGKLEALMVATEKAADELERP